MSPPGLQKPGAWSWKDLAPYIAIIATAAGLYSASNERQARLEERVTALQVAKTDAAASTQRELDRVARALEALQGDIKDLRDQIRTPRSTK